MIEALELLGRLALGLAALLGLGYVLAASLVPGLTRLERAAAGFGLGALVVTLWMLALAAWGCISPCPSSCCRSWSWRPGCSFL